MFPTQYSSILVIIAYCCSFAFDAISSSPFSLDDPSWEEYKIRFGKVYNGAKDEQIHKEAFIKRKRQIHEHNEAFSRGGSGYQMGFNKFTDMTVKNRKKMKGVGMDRKTTERLWKRKNIRTLSMDDVPDSVDWRKGNGSIQLVTSVKDQGDCGSCWAFSVAGHLEAVNAKSTGKLVDLSVQNLVDCDISDSHCDGGWPTLAIEFTISEGGLNTESAYPYVGYRNVTPSPCYFNKSAPIGAKNIHDVVEVPVGDERALMEAVAKNGPISVLIVSCTIFYYEGGIFDDPECSNKYKDLDHAVLVVGYGTDPKWGDYWIVKNSWGKQWGENGYIRMARNKGNQCGIAIWAIYAQ